MKLQEIKSVAKRTGVSAGKMKKTELIRSIQRAEGNRDCYATAYVNECNQMNCIWRADCLNEA